MTNWNPKRGRELNELLVRELKDPGARPGVATSTLDILGKCLPPGEQGERTGLVVGYVQSGKTLSFTAVAAAGQDNGFRIVIILAGTTLDLAQQSRNRTRRALNIGGGTLRPWISYHNPGLVNRDSVSAPLEDWDLPHGRTQTVLLTILKKPQRLCAAAEMLEQIPDHFKKSALIIDDEADQASLNTMVRRGRESPTYVAIRRLRDALPSHTLLQYTATPQAQIFIPLVDQLSPSFCEVLEPGQGYTGGKVFFRDRIGELVRQIPLQDLALTDPAQTPESLLEALQLYLLGVACGYWIAKRDRDLDLKANRSMMVHPSRLQGDHHDYFTKVQSALAQWRGLLEDRLDPDHARLLGEFETRRGELARTYPEIRDLDRIGERLAFAIRQTQVCQVNSASDIRRIESWTEEWEQHYPWILVGGQKLDRGFTVEGLTVTYMPRPVGVGLADTVQQRGRFFGYKESYLGLCRVYLDPDVCRAFEVYVDSEESMRDFLRRNGEEGDLKSANLRRRFILDRSLQPTRRAILLDPPVHRGLVSGWFNQRYPHFNVREAGENQDIVKAFTDDRPGQLIRTKCDWLLDPERARATHHHFVHEGFSFAELLNAVLSKLQIVEADDAEDWLLTLAIVEEAAERAPDACASIVYMRPSETSNRGTASAGGVTKIPGGPYPPRDPGKWSVYAGDSKVLVGQVSLQVYMFDIHEGRVTQGSPARWRGVPLMRLWLDDSIYSTLIEQQ